MIKSALQRTFQLLFVLMIAYAGSFVLMEESAEKTEKTEKSEEALCSLYHSKHHGKTLKKGLSASDQSKETLGESGHNLLITYFLPKDFNIHFIYHTSYLELRG